MKCVHRVTHDLIHGAVTYATLRDSRHTLRFLSPLSLLLPALHHSYQGNSSIRPDNASAFKNDILHSSFYSHWLMPHPRVCLAILNIDTAKCIQSRSYHYFLMENMSFLVQLCFLIGWAGNTSAPCLRVPHACSTQLTCVLMCDILHAADMC